MKKESKDIIKALIRSLRHFAMMLEKVLRGEEV